MIWDKYLFNQPDSAFYYAQQQYNYAKEKGLKKYMSKALNTQGIYSSIRKDYLNAINYYTSSLKLKEELNDKKGVTAALNNLGIIYTEQGNYIKAIGYYMRSLKIHEELNDMLGTATSLNNIGNIYSAQKDYSSAIDYFRRSLKICQDIGYKAGIASALNNIGTMYHEQKEYDLAIKNYSQSLSISEETENQSEKAISINNIGNVHLEHGENEKAIDYYLRGLKIAEQMQHKSLMAATLNNIGKAHFNLKNYSSSIDYSSKALTLASETDLLTLIKESAENLYKVYERVGDVNKAFDNYKLYTRMRDSIGSIETHKEIVRWEFKYQYDKKALADSLSLVKQRELDKMALRTERFGLLGGVLLLLVGLGIYLRIRFIKRLAEKEMLLQQIKLLKAEMRIQRGHRIPAKETSSELDREKIEKTINSKLNPSDWSILNALYQNPIITNKQLAEQVSLSIGGVRSSLAKMYELFNVEKAKENQRIALVAEAIKISTEF